VVPNSVAEVELVPQVIAKVTLVPGVAVDGDTSMTGFAANTGPAETARVAAPARASVTAAERMKRIVCSPVRTRDLPAPLPSVHVPG